jgi:formate dehydrogenase subunit delta
LTPKKLTFMANQIAAFFVSYPTEEAAAKVQQHLVAFWTPAMLDTLEAHMASGVADVHELLLRALPRPAAVSAAAPASAPPSNATQLAADAG